MAALHVPRLVIGAAGSSAGKTTLTVALLAALRARGLRVAPFKCGPDYLDPGYHARAAGAPVHNLDGWMMGREAVAATFARAARGADVAVIEGVMGLFDGASPTGDEGSTAEIARWLQAPVVLALDASGMARTAAAVAGGLAAFDPRVRIGGVVCNRLGSPGHLALLRQAVTSPPLLGGLPARPDLSFPERHLGLVTAFTGALPDEVVAAWARIAEEWLDLDAIVALARSAPPIEDQRSSFDRLRTSGVSRSADDLRTSGLTNPARGDPSTGSGEPRADASENTLSSPTRRPCRIGVAWDEAFHFYYEDNLARLEALGATVVRFSPLHDAALPDVDGLVLGGGYPEEHAAAFAANGAMRAAIRAFAASGRPVYAECGGLMALATAIRTRDGRDHEAVGILPGVAVVRDRLQALGYAEVTTVRDSILGPAGVRFRGHQFRYSELLGVPGDVPRAYAVAGGPGGPVAEGYAPAPNVLASYVHAHWASCPGAAEGLVAACAAGRT